MLGARGLREHGCEQAIPYGWLANCYPPITSAAFQYIMVQSFPPHIPLDSLHF